MSTWGFWGLAAASVVASLLVVGQRHAVRAIVALAALLGAVAGLFVLLSAPFAAMVQVVLYAGGVLAIVLPVVLFLDLPDESDDGIDIGPGAATRRLGVVLAVVLVVELAWAFQHLRGAALPPGDGLPGTSPSVIGHALMVEHGPVVLLAVMLALVVVVGVVLLVRREAP